MSNDNDGGWCDTVIADSGNQVSGGAARNVRIKRSGGLRRIIRRACQTAASEALREANLRPLRADGRSHLRLVKKSA